MRFIVYGAGAIGGTIGGRLAEHGHEVELLARGAHLEVLRAAGLRLVAPDHEVRLALRAHGGPAEVSWRDDDVVVLAMKTQDTEAALRELVEHAPSTVAVVCAQNGVENERLALRRFERVYAMCVMLPATHLEPGVVVAHSAPTTGILDVGRYPAGVDATVAQVTGALSASSFSARPDPHVLRFKYAKLLLNLANALEATVGDKARGTGLYKQAKAEALACYAAAGIDVASDDEDKQRRGDLLRVDAVQGHHRVGGSSTQSLARGAGTIEADHLNGEIVLLGRLHGVPTPVNEALQRAANRAALERRPPGSMALHEVVG